MSKIFLKTFLATLLLVALAPVQADDIDLFVGSPTTDTQAPNVLIILDNTANWSTAFPSEMAALASVVSTLPVDKVRLGILMGTESGGGDSNTDGGYIRAAIRLMNSSNKINYINMVNSFVDSDKSNNPKPGLMMEEAYRYFSAGAPYAGNNKVKTDYTSNLEGTLEDVAVHGTPGNALASKAAASYVSPIADGCAKNFIIYISNGAGVDNQSNFTKTETTLNAFKSGAAATIPVTPAGQKDSLIDEWARFMKESNLAVTTYTIEVYKSSNQPANWTAQLQSAATVSDGTLFDVTANPSAANVAAALNTALSEIQSVNSVFAAVSLPVSVNTQGTYLNQVYIGMFRPDHDSKPLWAGNLKQYKLGYNAGVLKLLDADTKPAINSSTGFITECARSFWTPTATDSYWAAPLTPQGGICTVGGTAVDTSSSNFPDGNVVEKGAQAYMLRNVSNVSGRTVKTCGLSSCTALSNFDNTTVSGSDLNPAPASALDDPERDALINWARGQDVNNEDIDAETTAEMRPSVHGDVVHSRPVAINFGSDAAGSRKVMLFYGGNDGMLRAVNGNRPDLDNTDIGGKAPGQELWSFVPPEFYAKFKRLKDNTTLIAYPGQPAVTPPAPTPIRKDYAMDGPVAAYKVGATSAWVYAAMRRGGRNLYAFNVPAATPESPTLLWRSGCPDPIGTTGCTTGLEGIGQTWSTPKVLKASGYGAGASPMLIMGGGYDTCEDTDNGTVNHSCTSSTKGNKIYLLRADTGALLQAFDTDRAVVADVVVVPDSSGLIKYAYAADLGGNVYRISGASANVPIGSTAPSTTSGSGWTITKIASLGCATASSCSANRKFMFAPSVIEDGSTYYLTLGSGDREKPLLSYTAASAVTNYFFMLKDQPTAATWLSDESTNCPGGATTALCLNSLTAIAAPTYNATTQLYEDSVTPSSGSFANKKGWYLGLIANEQVVTSAVTVFDTVTFSTHQPTPPASGLCSDLGTARVYNINYLDASSSTQRSTIIVGGGLPPSPVAGMVTLDDGSTVPFLIGGKGTSALEGGEPPSPAVAAQPKARVFWNIEQ